MRLRSRWLALQFVIHWRLHFSLATALRWQDVHLCVKKTNKTKKTAVIVNLLVSKFHFNAKIFALNKRLYSWRSSLLKKYFSYFQKCFFFYIIYVQVVFCCFLKENNVLLKDFCKVGIDSSFGTCYLTVSDRFHCGCGLSWADMPTHSYLFFFHVFTTRWLWHASSYRGRKKPNI